MDFGANGMTILQLARDTFVEVLYADVAGIIERSPRSTHAAGARGRDLAILYS